MVLARPAVAGVPPAVLVHPPPPHPVQAGGVARSSARPASRTALFAGRRTGAPTAPPPGRLHPRRGRGGGVLTPHVPAPRTAVAEQARCRSVGRHLTGTCANRRITVSRGTPSSPYRGASAGPFGDVVGLHHPAPEHRVTGTVALAGDAQASRSIMQNGSRSAQSKGGSATPRSSGWAV